MKFCIYSRTAIAILIFLLFEYFFNIHFYLVTCRLWLYFYSITHFNTYVPNARFLYPLKTSENRWWGSLAMVPAGTIPQKQFIIIIFIIIIINHHLSSPSTLLIIIPLAAIAINNVGQLINSSVEYWKWNVWTYVFFVFFTFGFWNFVSFIIPEDDYKSRSVWSMERFAKIVYGLFSQHPSS